MDRPVALASGPPDDSGAAVRIERTDIGTTVTVVEGTPWTPGLARLLGDLLALPRLEDVAASPGALAQLSDGRRHRRG